MYKLTKRELDALKEQMDRVQREHKESLEKLARAQRDMEETQEAVDELLGARAARPKGFFSGLLSKKKGETLAERVCTYIYVSAYT